MAKADEAIARAMARARARPSSRPSSAQTTHTRSAGTAGRLTATTNTGTRKSLNPAAKRRRGEDSDDDAPEPEGAHRRGAARRPQRRSDDAIQAAISRARGRAAMREGETVNNLQGVVHNAAGGAGGAARTGAHDHADAESPDADDPDAAVDSGFSATEADSAREMTVDWRASDEHWRGAGAGAGLGGARSSTSDSASVDDAPSAKRGRRAPLRSLPRHPRRDRLRVHILSDELKEDHADVLLSNLDSKSGVVVTGAGGDVEVPDVRSSLQKADIVVGGRPTADQLRLCDRASSLVIPWAGVPPETAELVQACRPGMRVYNMHQNAPATAEMGVTLLLAAAKRVIPRDYDLREGRWTSRYDPSVYGTLSLFEKSALIVGYGAVGKRIAAALRALGMNVTALCRSGTTAKHATQCGAGSRKTGCGCSCCCCGDSGDGGLAPVKVMQCNARRLRSVLPAVHALVIAAPLTEETNGLIGAVELNLLPPGAVVVNVGRGPIVDETALFEALASGHLGAAGLDVWYRYPKSQEERTTTLPSVHPFHSLTNVVLSPHVAGKTEDTEGLRYKSLAGTLEAIATGSVVPTDLARGY